MKLFALTAIALGALIGAPVHAADQTILGYRFQMKWVGAPWRMVQVKAKEKGSPNTIVGDPVVNGATLSVRAAGAHLSRQIIALPQGTASNGKPFWSGSATNGFKYRDSKGEQGPVKSVTLRKSGSGIVSLQAQLSGKVQPLNLVPPNPGTDACVLLDINGGDTYSVRFVGGTIVNQFWEYTHRKVTTEGTCVPSCSDGLLNGTESDVDCGGEACPTCDHGNGCSVDGDCTSGVCRLGTCQASLCTDGVANGDETDIDCGGSCPADCAVDQGCGADDDCVTAYCSSGLCKCASVLYTFTVVSTVGDAFTPAEWPGGGTAQTVAPTCQVTVNAPDDNIELVCAAAAPFSVAGFTGYSSCVGSGGEDGDGCQPLTCPTGAVGSCCDARPSCSSGLNGSASAQFFVQCLE